MASYDASHTKYFSQVTKKPEGTEIANELEMMVAKSLRRYAGSDGKLPTRVFYYRSALDP